jgi:biopolymer transport protein ExbD
MAMQVASAEGDEPELNTTINTTPLVDVMLVLLIIFLITIPVIVKVVPVNLPNAKNIPTTTKPENIVLAVDKNENIYWNNQPVADTTALFEKLKPMAILVPQPEVHIRGDRDARFESIGRVMATCSRAGILKVGFITNPELPGME